MTAIANNANIMAFCSWLFGRRPFTVVEKQQAANGRQKRARKKPPGFAEMLRGHCPRTKCDQDVVIPQAGQRIPKMTRMLHGGRPSCWWVPSPALLGSRVRATPSNSSGPSPTRTAENLTNRDRHTSSAHDRASWRGSTAAGWGSGFNRLCLKRNVYVTKCHRY